MEFWVRRTEEFKKGGDTTSSHGDSYDSFKQVNSFFRQSHSCCSLLFLQGFLSSAHHFYYYYYYFNYIAMSFGKLAMMNHMGLVS